MIYYTTKRPAFSMITAISVMLIMGLLSSFILSTSASTSEETFTQYRKEQAVLLSEAYTEAAMLRILQNNMAAPTPVCINAFTANITNLLQGQAAVAAADIANLGRGYHVDVNISYITNTIANPRPTNITTANCGTILNLNALGNLLDFNNTFALAPTASLSVIIDVYVRYKNTLSPDIPNSPWITYHRRTLQKI
jgi:hypothetical protein